MKLAPPVSGLTASKCLWSSVKILVVLCRTACTTIEASVSPSCVSPYFAATSDASLKSSSVNRARRYAWELSSARMPARWRIERPVRPVIMGCAALVIDVGFWRDRHIRDPL